MFKKITNLTHSLSFKHTDKLLYRFGVTAGKEFIGISYYDVTNDLKNDILKIIPPERREHYSAYCFIVNSKVVLPHTDHKVKTTINFYNDTAEAITTFYELKQEYKTNIIDHSGGHAYPPDRIKYADHFIAAPGEIWILNVSQIHSVKCNKSENRTAFCLQTELSFDEVLNDISQSGYFLE